jgi:hypothetical protein
MRRYHPAAGSPASGLSTTTEVRLCQCCDFAAQAHPNGHYAVTVSLLKVNSPCCSVNNCERAVRGPGLREYGHLLSSEGLGIMEEEQLCRS